MPYNNELKGVIFKNKKKLKDTHPDYTGSCQINGEHFYISAWTKEKDGEKYFSCSFNKKEEAKPSSHAVDIKKGQKHLNDIQKDDLPF